VIHKYLYSLSSVVVWCGVLVRYINTDTDYAKDTVVIMCMMTVAVVPVKSNNFANNVRYTNFLYSSRYEMNL
jgi:hypothetical protein